MGSAGLPEHRRAGEPGLDRAALERLGRDLEQLSAGNALLQVELERCHQQLNAIFAITHSTATLQDPAAIQRAVLDCHIQLFHGVRVLLCTRHGVQRLHADPRPVTLPDDHEIVGRLADSIGAARRAGGFDPDADASFDERIGAHVLLGRFVGLEAQEEYDVLITLRTRAQPAFDRNDRLVSETVLVYGGHVLNHARSAQREADAALETVLALANAIDARDAYTRGHSERVAWLARQVGQAGGLGAAALQQLEWAGLLHDVGKIGVPEALLKKVERLTPQEFALIQEHARTGYEVLRPVRRLADVAEAVLYHHEDWNGNGYPYGIAGEQIPWMARVLRICDTFDAMTSARSYRAQSTVDNALQELLRVAGQATDPALTALFVERMRAQIANPSPDFRRRFGHVLQQSMELQAAP